MEMVALARSKAVHVLLIVAAMTGAVWMAEPNLALWLPSLAFWLSGVVEAAANGGENVAATCTSVCKVTGAWLLGLVFQAVLFTMSIVL